MIRHWVSDDGRKGGFVIELDIPQNYEYKILENNGTIHINYAKGGWGTA